MSREPRRDEEHRKEERRGTWVERVVRLNGQGQRIVEQWINSSLSPEWHVETGTGVEGRGRRREPDFAPGPEDQRQAESGSPLGESWVDRLGGCP